MFLSGTIPSETGHVSIRLVMGVFAVACAMAFGTEPPATGPTTRPAVGSDGPFEYFSNPWTVIGLKDGAFGTRITPKGELVLADGLRCRPLIGTPPRSLGECARPVLREGHLPIVVYEFAADGGVRGRVEAFACPLESDDPSGYGQPVGNNFLNLVRLSLANTGDTPATVDFSLEWQPKEGPIILALEKVGTAGVSAVLAAGRLLAVIQPADGQTLTVSGFRVEVRTALRPVETAHAVVCLPFASVDKSDPVVDRMVKADFSARRSATAAFWNGLLQRGAQVEVPESKPADTYKASLVYQFIGRDKGEVHAGEGFYDELFLRDGAYQAISLAHAGFTDDAKQSLEHFLRFQRDDGRFESQAGQLDAHGYAMWALVEYYRLTGDREWLARIWPPVRKAAEWIRQARRQEKDPASPFFGILPNALADGEFLWDGKYHIVGYDWQNLRGLQAAAEAARALGYEKAREGEAPAEPRPTSREGSAGASPSQTGPIDDAQSLEDEFLDYRKSILRAIDRTGLPYIPPSYEKAGTHWGNLEAIFPTLLIDPQDPRLTATLEHVHTRFGAAEANPGGFIEGIIQWNPPGSGAIHPYMSQFVTNSHIIRGETREAIDGFYSFLLHTTSTHGFPEGVYWKKREAWGDTLPHLWAAALYETTLRNMLIREQDDELHLLSCVPGHWLTEGKGISVDGAPTHFGRVSFTATARGDVVELNVRPPDRTPPHRVVIHAPDTMTIVGAEVNGKPAEVTDGRQVLLSAEFARTGGTVTMHVNRSSDASSMTYASRVAAYLRTAP